MTWNRRGARRRALSEQDRRRKECCVRQAKAACRRTQIKSLCEPLALIQFAYQTRGVRRKIGMGQAMRAGCLCRKRDESNALRSLRNGESSAQMRSMIEMSLRVMLFYLGVFGTVRSAGVRFILRRRFTQRSGVWAQCGHKDAGPAQNEGYENESAE